MRRRAFITLLGGAAAWPLVARAQTSTPVVGYLISRGADDAAHLAAAFRRGLRDAGFIDGQTVRIEYRWAHGRHGRLPALARDLVNHQAVVIVTTGGEPSALAAKAATSKIPIVFVIDGDPVIIGLVESLNNPGGNATGLSLISPALEAQRLGLVNRVVPDDRLEAEAEAMARKLAALPQHAVRQNKLLVNRVHELAGFRAALDYRDDPLIKVAGETDEAGLNEHLRVLRHGVRRELLEAELAGKVERIVALRAIRLEHAPALLLGGSLHLHRDERRAGGEAHHGSCYKPLLRSTHKDAIPARQTAAPAAA